MIIWDGNENIVSVITNDDGISTFCANLEKLDADLEEIDRQFKQKMSDKRRIIIAGPTW